MQGISHLFHTSPGNNCRNISPIQLQQQKDICRQFGAIFAQLKTHIKHRSISTMPQHYHHSIHPPLYHRIRNNMSPYYLSPQHHLHLPLPCQHVILHHILRYLHHPPPSRTIPTHDCTTYTHPQSTSPAKYSRIRLGPSQLPPSGL